MGKIDKDNDIKILKSIFKLIEKINKKIPFSKMFQYFNRDLLYRPPTLQIKIDSVSIYKEYKKSIFNGKWEEYYEKNSQQEDLREWFNEFALKYKIGITVYHDPSDPSAIAKIDEASNVDCVKGMNAVSPGISCVHKYISKRDLLINKNV